MSHCSKAAARCVCTIHPTRLLSFPARNAVFPAMNPSFHPSRLQQSRYPNHPLPVAHSTARPSLETNSRPGRGILRTKMLPGHRAMTRALAHLARSVPRANKQPGLKNRLCRQPTMQADKPVVFPRKNALPRVRIDAGTAAGEVVSGAAASPASQKMHNLEPLTLNRHKKSGRISPAALLLSFALLP